MATRYIKHLDQLSFEICLEESTTAGSLSGHNRAIYTRKNKTCLTKDASYIRCELYHLYQHVLSKTRTAHINGSRLTSVRDSFSCDCCL